MEDRMDHYGDRRWRFIVHKQAKRYFIFFAAAGDYQTCRTNGNTQTSLSIYMAGYDIGTGDGYRNYGRQVRPVMDIQGI